jgi:hypothetical protein
MYGSGRLGRSSYVLTLTNYADYIPEQEQRTHCRNLLRRCRIQTSCGCARPRSAESQPEPKSQLAQRCRAVRRGRVRRRPVQRGVCH